MKSIKLSLAVLMLAAAFTACTKEEFAPTQDIQKDEFVGAKLIGSNLSMDFVREGETRVDANGNWEKGDEAGMAWIITGDNATIEQDASNSVTVSSVPYANHLFVMGDSDFTTYGNVYEGWHFSYYPYTYMPKQGVEMKVNMNPTQKDVYDVDQYKTRLNLSARQFLTAEDNLDGRQLVDVNLKLRRAVKTIKVKVKPEDAIKGNAALQDLAITKVELASTDGDVKPFYQTNDVVLNLSKVPYVKYNVDTEKYDETATEKYFYDNLMSVWSNAESTTDIATSVENSDLNLSDDQIVRFYTLPSEDYTVDSEQLKVTVFVEAGKFEVAYVAPEDEDYNADVDGKNNEYLNKLATAYSTEKGYLHSFTKDNDMQALNLEFILTSDMFSTNFTNISSEQEWNKAVEMVDALGLDEATFTIVRPSKTTKWSFVDCDGDGNLINLPEEAELTVTHTDDEDYKQNLIVDKANAEWPTSENFIVNMDVEVRANLTVNGVMDVVDDVNNGAVVEYHTIYNGAVITAGEEATIGNKEDLHHFENRLKKEFISANTDNDKLGTVVVKYGAYVYPHNAHTNTIAYVVESATPTEIVKINRLVGINSTLGLANVNTLIVKTELDLNALAIEGIENDDRYEDTGIAGKSLADLGEKNILIKLEGGSLVKKLAGVNTKVSEIIAVSGANTIDNVIVNGDITVNEGATLNIVNTVVDLPKTYFYAGTIVNAGTLNTNNVSLNLSGAVENEGSIKVENGDLWYTGSIENDGSMSGKINPGQATSFVVNTEAGLLEVVEKATTGSTVALADDVLVTNSVKVSNKTITFDLNGNTIENKTTNASDQCVVFAAIDEGKLIIKGDGNVKASGTAPYTIAVWAYDGEITIKGGNFTNVGPSDGSELIYANNKGKVTIEGGTFKAGKKSAGLSDQYAALNVYDSDYQNGTASITVSGGEFFKFNPADNKSEGDGTNFLKDQPSPTEKYISEKSGDWYVVKLINL